MQFFRTYFPRSVFLFILCGLASCTTILKEVLQKPQMSLENVAVTNVALNEVALELVLKVTNPNSFTVNMAGIDYQVNALGMTLGEGAIKEALVLAPQEPVTVKIPLSLQPQAAFKFAQAYLAKSKDLVASVETTVHFQSPLGPLSLDFKNDQKLR